MSFRPLVRAERAGIIAGGPSLIVVSQQVRKFVIRREVQPKGEGKKPYTKAPKIQRLVTPQRLQHKRHRIALKRRHAEAAKDAAVCCILAC